tara:strand:- start:10974 stop:11078 length:105 start_codon:yes stop_codon:yes gene_type:complete
MNANERQMLPLNATSGDARNASFTFGCELKFFRL